jgi:hypothetical protein
MAAVAVGLQLNVSPVRIQEQLNMFRNMAGRQEIYEAGGYTIISDCYNAGPESMAAALKVLGKRKGRRIAVLGDMLELGDVTWAEHFRIGRIAAENAEIVKRYSVENPPISSPWDAKTRPPSAWKRYGESVRTCIRFPTIWILSSTSLRMHTH